jgi:hypothetical protein
MVQSSPNDPLLHVLVVIDPLQKQGKDEPIVENAAMTAAVSGAKTRHRDQPVHPRGLHGIDQDARRSREKRGSFDDGPKGDVDPERLNNHVDVFECIPNRVTTLFSGLPYAAQLPGVFATVVIEKLAGLSWPQAADQLS